MVTSLTFNKLGVTFGYRKGYIGYTLPMSCNWFVTFWLLSFLYSDKTLLHAIVIETYSLCRAFPVR